MKLLTASLALGCLLAGSSVQAGLFRSEEKLPKPVDYPVVRPKVKETHKVPHMLHTSQYQKQGWGLVKFGHNPPRPLGHQQLQ